MRRLVSVLPKPAGLSRRPAVVALAVAVAGAIPVLIWPSFGTDLAAQLSWADFVGAHPGSAYNLGWYGGAAPAGYSLLAPYVLSVVGVRAGMAMATFATAWLVGDCLRAGHGRREAWAAVAAGLALDANLLAGRATFTLGLMTGVATIRILLPGPSDARRTAGATVTAGVTTCLSPVAGLFVGLAAAVLLFTGHRRSGAWVGCAAGLPLAVMAAGSPSSGVQPDGLWTNVVAPLGVCLLVMVCVRRRPLRIATMIYCVGLLLSFLLPTPVGGNSERLALLFAAPVLLAFSHRRTAVLASAVALLSIWQVQQPLRDALAGPSPAASPAYNAPVLAELARLHADRARVEAVPEADHWESLLGSQVLLARGWERQLDVARNPIFYSGPLRPAAYHRWLNQNAVGYVVVSDRPPDWAAVQEAALVHAGQPWLPKVWQGKHWTVYRVRGSEPLAGSPATVIATTPARIEIRVARRGSFLLRVQWSPWLQVSGGRGCVSPAGRWTRVHVPAAGRYTVAAPYRLDAGDSCPSS